MGRHKPPQFRSGPVSPARLSDMCDSTPTIPKATDAAAVGFGGFAYAVAGAVGGNKYIGADFCDETPEDPACADL